MDVRRRHVESGLSAEDIGDIVSFLLDDYSFMSRRHLTCVFKLCCLIVDRPLWSCLKLLSNWTDVQRLLPLWHRVWKVCKFWYDLLHINRAFFTEGTMENVRESIACSPKFMASAAFDPWESHVPIALTSSRGMLLLLISTWLERRRRPKKDCVTLIGRLILCVFLLLLVHLHLGLGIRQGRLCYQNPCLVLVHLLPNRKPVAVLVPQEVKRGRRVCLCLLCWSRGKSVKRWKRILPEHCGGVKESLLRGMLQKTMVRRLPVEKVVGKDALPAPASDLNELSNIFQTGVFV